MRLPAPIMFCKEAHEHLNVKSTHISTLQNKQHHSTVLFCSFSFTKTWERIGQKDQFVKDHTFYLPCIVPCLAAAATSAAAAGQSLFSRLVGFCTPVRNYSHVGCCCCLSQEYQRRQRLLLPYLAHGQELCPLLSCLCANG
jgi:hypothetical protein